MTVDDAGIAFIRGFEGFSASVYNDVAGRPTVGIGHLIKSSESFPTGITLNQAEQLLWQDLEGPETACQRLVPTACTQQQWNALASFAFNEGVEALEQLIAHGWENIPAQLLRWNKAHVKGVVTEVPGLTRRRQAEAALFRS